MRLAIKRAQWVRGRGMSYLYNPTTELMCCLGFLGVACGASTEQLGFKTTPLRTLGVVWPKELFFETSTHKEISVVCSKLMLANDRIGVSDEDREKELHQLFASIGIQVCFED